MEDLINQLPDECLQHIFSFLPILDRLVVEKGRYDEWNQRYHREVSKRWRIIGKRGWPNIKRLTIESSDSDNIIRVILQRCGRFLEELEISISSKQYHLLSMVIQFCKLDKLKCIRILSDFEYEDRQIQFAMYNLMEILRKARNLVDLTIVEDFELYDIDYFNVANRMTLRRLEVVNLNEEVILFNPDQYPHLRELELTAIEIDDDAMSRGEESLKGLEKINIQNCHIPIDFIERIQSFTNLQELTLTDNICNATNGHIRQIARHCAKMKKITLSGTSSMTSECFKYLETMPSLEFLSFEHFNNVNNRDIMYLKNVRKLNFEYCTGILEDDGLIQLITNSSNLEKLELYHIPDLDGFFMNNVRRIFHHDLRQKHLSFKVSADYSDELLGIMRDPNNHPLLELKLLLLNEDGYIHG